MTNTQLLILATVLIAIYFYWKKPTKPQSTEEEPFTKELPAEKKDWFSEKRWLSDQEIDWALTQIKKEWIKKNPVEPTPPAAPNTIWLPPASTVKVPFFTCLEATQFMFAKEAMEIKDAEARDSFPVLLSELTGTAADLVFIPVNNPNFHWSLLVYEIKSKKFYHYDTLKGANDGYVKPLVKELLKFLLADWQDSSDHFETRYRLQQGNTWDCGIAVIEIAKRIVQSDSHYLATVDLITNFDFPHARQAWRKRLLDYYGK